MGVQGGETHSHGDRRQTRGARPASRQTGKDESFAASRSRAPGLWDQNPGSLASDDTPPDVSEVTRDERRTSSPPPLPLMDLENSPAQIAGVRLAPGADRQQIQKWAKDCGWSEIQINGEILGGSIAAWRQLLEGANPERIGQIAETLAHVEIVAVVGSRRVRRLDLVRAGVDSLPANTVVISGAGGSVDKTAAAWARRGRRPVREFPAEWDRYPGRQAGPIRNSQVVAIADRVLAFWDGASRGTADTIRKARAAGKPVEIITLPGF